MLSIAVGAAAAVFSIVNALVLKPLPYPAAERLATPAIGARVWSTAMLDAFQRTNTTFEMHAGLHERSVSVSTGEEPAVVRLEAVSASYFELLGIPPSLGRVFTAAEDRVDAPSAVALISDALWHRHFGGDPGVLGRSLLVDVNPEMRPHRAGSAARN